MHRQKFRGGILRARVADAFSLETFLGLIASQSNPVRRLEQRELNGTPVVVKTEDLRGKARVRYALRRTGREREFDNLHWLQERGFRVVPPLAAGTLLRSGLPTRQWLVTQFLEGEVQLDQFAKASDVPELRSRRFGALAREIARMHALGFVHRDLYPRNLLVSNEDLGEDRPVILDAWRGGPGWGLRGPAWDVGSLVLEPEKLGTEEERGALLEAYFAERAALRKPVGRSAFMTSVEKARATQLERLRARANRTRKA